MKKISILVSLLLIMALVFGACTSQDASNGNATGNEGTVDEQDVTEDTDTEEDKDIVEEEPKDPVTVNVYGLKGPTSIGMIKLIDEKALNDDVYTVEYTTVEAPDMLTGKIINGEIQIAAVPTNLAATLYNKTEGDVQFLAQNTLGVLYAVGSDTAITSLADLEGKKVVASGAGSVPEFAMNYMLEQNGLTDKVTLDYQPDHATAAQLLIGGDADVAILPQPFATQVQMQNEDIKVLIDLNEEWAVASDNASVLSMGALVINADFAKNNPEFVAEFLKLYEESVNFVNENPKEASILVEENGILPSAALVEKAIPYCAIVYKDAQSAKDEINNFLEILFNSNNASIGGKLPDDNFYYSE